MKITLTVLKSGLALEAELSKITRRLQKTEHMNYHKACEEAEKLINNVAYTQVIHTESNEVDLKSLGQHLAHGAPFRISASN